MPLLQKVFVKRDKTSNNLDVPNNSSHIGRNGSKTSSKSSEYVFADSNTPPDSNGDEHRTVSPSSSKHSDTNSSKKGSSTSSRLKFGFKRKATTSEKGQAITNPRLSMSMSTWSEALEPPPSRTSVFGAFGRSSSSHSLPEASPRNTFDVPPQLPPIRLRDSSPSQRPPAFTSQTLPIPKTPEMRTSNIVKVFNRGSKPTKITDAPKLDLRIPASGDDIDSFNIRSFRAVRPASPAPPVGHPATAPVLDQIASNSPLSLAPPSPIGTRSRGDSVGSESSQRMTVAQFRQAQAESSKNRSSVHLPVPEHPSDGMPPGNVPLHVNLSRPVSPSFALAASPRGVSPSRVSPSGHDSAGEGELERPARLAPPSATGRFSPIPRQRTASSPGQRPVSNAQTQEGSRLSAKWMLTDDSTDSDSSDGTASDEAARQRAGRPLRKPPLIGDFRKLRGNSPQSSPGPSPYPSSSFTGSPRAGISGSRSDLGHSSSNTMKPLVPRSSTPTQTTQTPPRQSNVPSPIIKPITPSSSPSAITNIRPGEYSGSRARAPSIGTLATEESVDVWSNTHSQVHSRQGSHEQLRGGTRSEIGHRSPQVRGAALGNGAKSHKPSGVSRSLSKNLMEAPTSSFTNTKASRGKPPADTDTSEEEHTSTSEDDAPLSALVPPKRPGSSLSSRGSPSPTPSFRGVPPDHSPARSRSPLIPASPGGDTTTKPSSFARSRQNSSATLSSFNLNNTTTPRPVPSKTSSVNSSLDPSERGSRGRKPLLDFSSSPNSNSTPSSPFPDSEKPKQPPMSTPSSFQTPRSRTNTLTMSTPDKSPDTQKDRIVSKVSSTTLRPDASSVQRPPMSRPLVREDSPASSIGNSSSGFPLTPRTGSEIGVNSTLSTSSGSSGNPPPRRPNQPTAVATKRNSVTFNDTVEILSNRPSHRREASGASDRSSGKRTDPTTEQRNERRRSEAKAAIELGKVVNGPPPVVDLDDDPQTQTPMTVKPQDWSQWQNMLQTQQQMQAMSMGLGPSTPGGMPGFNMGMPNTGFNPMMGMNMNMGNMMPSTPMFNPMMQTGLNGFPMPTMPTMGPMSPMMGMDPSMMVAHQQAMMVAKQAYQMAVAQQAMLAAGEEWERSSNMGGYSTMGSPAPSLFGMPTGSVYGGSTLGVGQMGLGSGGSVWGGSVYGGGFGAPSPQQRHLSPNLGPSFPSTGSEMEQGGRREPRKRAMTGPSSSLPPAHLRGAGAPPMPPPSSWKPN
ncbi:hypothetical protein FRB91_011381 [Serendipita sp. 411]|nr:hypothetical protein FRB91_011381 [Serendipita sp. 411]